MRPGSYKIAAKLIIEALPYIQKFAGKTVVVKYGGNAMINPEATNAVMQDVVLMRCVGIHPVLVHGGGPDIKKALTQMNIQSEFKNGLRVTDAATMEIVEMVLSGKTNKGIVSHLQRAGGQAIGLSGKDGHMILAEKETAHGDIGFVGKIKRVDPALIQSQISAGYIPVISSIGVGEDGQSYNINADTVAAAVAESLQAAKLILMTDVDGLYRDFEDKGSLISRITIDEAQRLIDGGQIATGMLPKIKACIDAVQAGVGAVHVINGTTPHTLIVELFTDQGIGTMVEK